MSIKYILVSRSKWISLKERKKKLINLLIVYRLFKFNFSILKTKKIMVMKNHYEHFFNWSVWKVLRFFLHHCNFYVFIICSKSVQWNLWWIFSVRFLWLLRIYCFIFQIWRWWLSNWGVEIQIKGGYFKNEGGEFEIGGW